MLGSTVTFYGRGYGHGVGMSQYGARGRALAGQDAATILAHYYRGTTLGTVPTTSRIRVRVLLRWRATPSVPLVVVGRRHAWTIDGVAGTFPADAKLRLIPTNHRRRRRRGGSASTSPAGGVLYSGAEAEPVRRPRRDRHDPPRAPHRSGTYDEYRGVLVLKAASTAPVVTVVNELPLETYLRGVVPAEMPSTWPAAALEAQAIAARSYAARRLRPGVSYYDVADDIGSPGLPRRARREGHDERDHRRRPASCSRAARRSPTRSSTRPAAARPSTTRTSTSRPTGAKVAGPVSYLRGSSDRRADGTAYDAGAPYATWSTRTYTRPSCRPGSRPTRGRASGRSPRSTSATAACPAG